MMIKLWYYAVFCFDGFSDWLISDRRVDTRDVREIPDADGKLHMVKELHITTRRRG